MSDELVTLNRKIHGLGEILVVLEQQVCNQPMPCKIREQMVLAIPLLAEIKRDLALERHTKYAPLY